MPIRFGQFLRRAASSATFVISLFAAVSTRGLEPHQYAVDVTAAVQTAPAQVRLNWTVDPNATGYTVARKMPDALTWTSLASLPSSASGYTDGSVSIGSSFEYRVVKTSSLGII